MEQTDAYVLSPATAFLARLSLLLLLLCLLLLASVIARSFALLLRLLCHCDPFHDGCCWCAAGEHGTRAKY